MKEKVLFEVCCGCFEDAVQAEKGGADRIELNSALFLGGLTPSIGTVQAVKNTLKIPVMCMVRPREGGFCYTDFDYMTCCHDMEALLNAGADFCSLPSVLPSASATSGASRTRWADAAALLS